MLTIHLFTWTITVSFKREDQAKILKDELHVHRIQKQIEQAKKIEFIRL